MAITTIGVQALDAPERPDADPTKALRRPARVGMHRMGPQPAKVSDFEPIVDGLRPGAPELEQLWSLRITALTDADGDATTACTIIERLQVSTSRTQIVAGSKLVHHLLPDLVPPMDREYTFSFFTGQKAVPSGDWRAFLEWFPLFATIGSRCRGDIEDAIRRGGLMAIGEAKVIDNAIMGFMQERRIPAEDLHPE